MVMLQQLESDCTRTKYPLEAKQDLQEPKQGQQGIDGRRT